jgi:glycosyltransferase involved in cell wall biosynthesis
MRFSVRSGSPERPAMPPEPIITSIIPTYRRPRLLRRAIKSILDQSFPDFKLCIYDNASGDETGDVVRSMAARDSRIHYYCHRENIGPQDNFIYGLSRAESPFVHLISDDDFLMPKFFAQAVSAMRQHPGAAFFSGGMLSAEPDGRVRGMLRYGSETDQVHRPPELFRILAPYTRTWTSALFRRAFVERLGGLKKETGYSFSIDLILRSAARFEAVLSDAPCAVFIVHSGSSSVAEAPEAFESLLNLAYFGSINEAVEAALRERVITDRDAAGMKQLIRTLTEKSLFKGGLAMIARRRLASAVRASEILSKHFEREDLAAMIGIGTLNNRCGSVVRITLRGAKAVRDAWLARSRRTRYSAYSELVKTRMREISD